MQHRFSSLALLFSLSLFSSTIPLSSEEVVREVAEKYLLALDTLDHESYLECLPSHVRNQEEGSFATMQFRHDVLQNIKSQGFTGGLYIKIENIDEGDLYREVLAAFTTSDGSFVGAALYLLCDSNTCYPMVLDEYNHHE